ncbi:GNAT family N-acetyltransferase [Sphingobium lactosutens]|uniref:GNAT family N-acetyltransferase n=1 Tax=Sphingobium lactosutens TaxID=522773 RepID=UPI001C4BF395|nr:GNAT family N-acetyltransferase [Sphingobium lactosutens]
MFDGNVPVFFAASERQDFVRFLEQDAINSSYLVIERNGRVVACGGLAFEKDGKTASLCWGMVDRGLQKTGLGNALTQARLTVAAAKPGVIQIRLDTSQHTQGFYARFGFQTERITQEGYGPGLDRWDMLLSL